MTVKLMIRTNILIKRDGARVLYPSIHFDDRTLITQWHCDCVRCGLWLVSMCVVLCLVCGDDLMCDVIDV